MIADVVQRRRAMSCQKKHARVKKRRRPAGRLPMIKLRYSLLADVPQSVLADEGRARLTDKAAAVSIRSVITVIGITHRGGMARWLSHRPCRSHRQPHRPRYRRARSHCRAEPAHHAELVRVAAEVEQLPSARADPSPMQAMRSRSSILRLRPGVLRSRTFLRCRDTGPTDGARVRFRNPRSFISNRYEFRPVAALTFAINQACAHCRADAQSMSNIRGMGDASALF